MTMLSHAAEPSARRSASCASTEVTRPGHSATWLVELASLGGRPMPSSAGKVISVPPPASALTTPPAKPAATRTRASRRVIGDRSTIPTAEMALRSLKFRASARRRSLRAGVDRVDRLAAGHEQAVPLGAAEADVAGDFGDADAAEQLARGVPYRHAAVADGSAGV